MYIITYFYITFKYLFNPNKTGIFNANLTNRNDKEPDSLVIKLNNCFKPNEINFTDIAKIDIDREIIKLENFYNTNKGKLTSPNAQIDFKLIGGASQISTNYEGGNEKLSLDRANSMKKYMLEYFRENPKLVDFINKNLKISTIIGETPYSKEVGVTAENKPKYDAEQFIKLELSVK